MAVMPTGLNAGSTVLPLLPNAPNPLGSAGAWAGALVDEASKGLGHLLGSAADDAPRSSRILSAEDNAQPLEQLPTTLLSDNAQSQRGELSPEDQEVLDLIGIRRIDPKLAKLALAGARDGAQFGHVGANALNASLTLMLVDLFPDKMHTELNLYRKSLAKRVPDVVQSLNLNRYTGEGLPHSGNRNVFGRVLGAAALSPEVSFSALHEAVKRHFQKFTENLPESITPVARAFGEAQRKVGLSSRYEVNSSYDTDTGSPVFTVTMKPSEPVVGPDGKEIEGVASGPDEALAVEDAAKKFLVELEKVPSQTPRRPFYPNLGKHLKVLDRTLGFELDASLVATALTQPNYSRGYAPARNYKRLAFIGKSFLPYAALRHLSRAYPDRTTTELVHIMYEAKRDREMTRFGQQLGVDGFLYGKTHPLKEEGTEGRTPVSYATEALFGAIIGTYDDIEEALEKVEGVFKEALPKLPPSGKAKLDEALRARGLPPSLFKVSQTGPNDFWVYLYIDQGSHRLVMPGNGETVWEAMDAAAERMRSNLQEIS
jgi:dsRNA-specific ribonuclease